MVEKLSTITLYGRISMSHSTNALLGVDIGTTNISAVVVDCDKQEIVETYTLANASKLDSEKDFFEYDAEWIKDKIIEIIDDCLEKYPNIKGIGLTGQMHGFVYLSADGQPVSPLYNWQDGRGNRLISESKTYCQEIYERTGYKCNSGYAFTTMFYNRINQIEPEGAMSFCSIMDYAVMELTGRKTPLIHMSNAAAFGLCDIENNCFDEEALNKLNLTNIVLPEIAKETAIAGYYKNIPVTVAIGDNQASFFGSVKDKTNTALVNIGTGSQVSVAVNEYRETTSDLEIRPYLFGDYLVSGSALCGGKAYAILENFFSEYARALIGEEHSQYELMNKMVEEAEKSGSPLEVSTLFAGTRNEPEKRGAIYNIDDKNFTPANLILGVLYGVAKELKVFFDNIGQQNITRIVAAGNAVKMNPVLQRILGKVFDSNITLTENNEEAAYGSALFAGISCSHK